jgi:hypothetical protein
MGPGRASEEDREVRSFAGGGCRWIVLCGLAACSVYDSDLLAGAGSANGLSGHDAAWGTDGGGSRGGVAGGSGPVGANGGTTNIGAEGGADAAGGDARDASAMGGNAAGAGGSAIDADASGGAAGDRYDGNPDDVRPYEGGLGGDGSVGTEGGTGGTAAGDSSDGEGASVLDLIDDMEDGDPFIQLVATPRRDGLWDTANDGTPAGTQLPAPSSFRPVLLSGSVPHAGDQYAAYTKGNGFTNYGAFMNVTMRSWADYNVTPTYDASGYAGISFWAKVGASSTTKVRVRFISADTDPRGGTCNLSGSVSELCYNHFYQDVSVATSWTRYSINFAEFVQGNSGRIFPAINLSRMYGLEFFFGAGTSFEVWIDDLSFVRK